MMSSFNLEYRGILLPLRKVIVVVHINWELKKKRMTEKDGFQCSICSFEFKSFKWFKWFHAKYIST